MQLKLVSALLLTAIGFAAAPSIGLAQRSSQVRAYLGQPFGVAEVAVAADADLLRAREQNGRALYPATIEASETTARLLFLFPGNEPFDLAISGAEVDSVRVEPVADPQRYEQLLRRWWDAYLSDARRSQEYGEYPGTVDAYLTSTLARRLNLLLPQPEPGGLFGLRRRETNPTLGLLTGSEELRLSLLKDTLLRDSRRADRASEPLPPPLHSAPLQLSAPVDVPVEDIALHVPQECFYLRFGSFANYQWFRSTLAEWGGDLRNLITVRGIDRQMNERLERQLVLREGALATLLGPQVISDVAVIGFDPFFQEGAAVGMLFEARNNVGLGADIQRQRAEALTANPAIRSRKIRIGDREVSLLTTADNRVRSFYAVDGNYHLVTTSSTMVRRFFEAGAGEGSLGGSVEFRAARSELPLEREDTAFVYLSDAFFQNLASPQYRIEMQRRLQANLDLELVRLAQLAAGAERKEYRTIDELVRQRLLPPRFGMRPDEAGPVLAEDGPVDTLRGARGFFTPIADIAFDFVTRAEAANYEQFARTFAREWGRVDPVMVGIRRDDTDTANVERIAIEVRSTPFAREHFGFFSNYIGPATTERVVSPDDNLASLDVVVGGPGLALFGGSEVTHLFAGVRDLDPATAEIPAAQLVEGRTLDWMRGYLGAWPRLGVLEFFTGRQPWEFDPEGYAQGQRGLWQRRFDDFSVLAMERSILEEATPQLAVVEAERPAQFRLRVADLTPSRLAGVLNEKLRQRAEQTSRSGVHFVERVVEQFSLPPDQGMVVASELIDGRLVCPLGGTYALVEAPDGQPMHWVSTAWAERDAEARQAPGYRAPPLEWFRGLEAHAALLDNRLEAHADLLVKRKPRGGLRLPTFPTLPVQPVEPSEEADSVEELPAPEPVESP